MPDRPKTTTGSVMTETDYRQIPEGSLPRRLVWTTPGRNQGQTVEVSYSLGIPAGKRVNYEADEGDRYMRQVDHSDGHTTYYARADQ